MYANNHIICIIYAKYENIDFFTVFVRKINVLYCANVSQIKQE